LRRTDPRYSPGRPAKGCIRCTWAPTTFAIVDMPDPTPCAAASAGPAAPT
jgi:hypothetical protein